MNYYTLGQTGLEISEIGFGGIPIMRLSQEEAVRVLRHAYEQGITFYDTANLYGDSEEKMGEAFQGLRGKIVIATKTMKRDAKGTNEDIENSLRMLKTDYIDLYQLHQIAQEKDWETIAGPGGALEAVAKAKEAGKIRHLGVTSHSLEMAVKMAKTKIFSTIQFPFNFIEDGLREKIKLFQDELGMGIIAMKPFGGGMIDNASLAFKFLRQYPEVIPIPGFDSLKSVDEIVALYQQANQVAEEDLQLMEKYKDELGKEFCRRCEYCQPCPRGVMITPSMLYKVVALRMSPEKAVSFSGKAVETVKNCVECGECEARCPYNLPITQILKKHYDLYEEHRNSLKTGE